MPSGRVDKPVIIDNQNGTVSIQYEPREEGQHELHIKFNHEHVQGTFRLRVHRGRVCARCLLLRPIGLTPRRFCGTADSQAVPSSSTWTPSRVAT